MKVYGASIDAVRLRGYGQADERPRGVPEDWVLRTDTISGRSPSYEEVAARVSSYEERLVAQGYYPHGWTINEDPLEGTYGPAEVSYWGPPGEEKDTWRIVGLVVGMAAAGLTVIGVGIGLMESQY